MYHGLTSFIHFPSSNRGCFVLDKDFRVLLYLLDLIDKSLLNIVYLYGMGYMLADLIIIALTALLTEMDVPSST